jgi:hypothetical protein
MTHSEYGPEAQNANYWPIDHLEPVLRCPVCNSCDSSQIYQGLRDIQFFCAPGEWSISRCNDCQSGYLNPRPTEASINRAYERY